jgi:hypothetical protein
VNVCLNIEVLCREAHYCSKSTLEKLENVLSIVGSSEIFSGLVAIPRKHLGDNLVQLRRGKRGTLLLHIFWRERQRTHFIFLSCK